MARRSRSRFWLGLAGLAPGWSPAQAQDAGKDKSWTLAASYKGDAVGVTAGRDARDGRYLDDLELAASVNLDRVVGWHSATVYVDVLNNLGGRPNDLAATLQGVDNIEVSAARLRLYQAWIEQKLADGKIALLAGLYDINSDFYHSDAAGVLIAPAFGMGSELSATGPNGPSTFPSTALALRGRVTAGDAYVQAAAVNADSGTLGDERGIDFTGHDGALMLGEVGWTGAGKVAVGVWAYTSHQPEVIPPELSQGDGNHVSHGAYVLAEHGLSGRPEGVRYLQGFLRLGISDGRTTPFRGGGQAGLLLGHVFAARPDSALSLGYNIARLSHAYRAANPVDSPPLARQESGVELTYSDCLAKWFCLQPDAQYVRHPSGIRDAHDAVIVGLRVTLHANLH